MKRWLALFIALLLCCGPTLAETAAVSGEPASMEEAELTGEAPEGESGEAPAEEPLEEPAPEPTFADSLLGWAANLDAQAYDLAGALRIGEDAWSALIQQDGDVTSICVDGLGALQLTGKDIALRVADQTYVLDLEPLLAAAQAPMYDEAALEADLEALQALLQRAAQALQPLIDYRPDYGGFTLHIALDEQDLRERLVGFIDDVLKDAAFERLYARYGDSLRLLVPELPASLRELRAGWELSKPWMRSRRPGFSLDADVQLNQSYGETSLACTGRYSDVWNRRQTGFSLEYAAGYDGFSAAACLDDASWGGVGSVSASLDFHAGRLTGTLLVEDGTASCFQLEALLVEDGVNATLDFRQDGERLWAAALYAIVDPEARTVRASLDVTDYGSSEPVSENLAALNISYWDQGYSGSLILPEDSLYFRGVTGSGFTHATAKLLSGQRSSQTVDLWLFRLGWSGYRARCEISESWSGREVARKRLSGEIGENGASFEAADLLHGTSTSGSVRYVQQYDGFSFDLELLADAQSYYARYMEDKLPFGVHISRSGDECAVTLTNTADYGARETLSARFGLDDAGALRWLEGDYTATYPRRPAPIGQAHVSYTPEKTVITSGEEVYTIEKLSESALAMAYQVRYMDQSPVTVALALDEALRTLSCSVTAEGVPLAEASLSATDKAQIAPIDREDAIPVDIELLTSLLDELTAPAQPVAEAYVDEPDVPADEPEAGDAVESAAEAVEAAVEAAEAP